MGRSCPSAAKKVVRNKNIRSLLMSGSTLLHTELDQHPIGILGVQEADELVVGPILWFGIQQRKARRRQALHLRTNIGHLECNMMHALPTFVDIPADNAVGPQPLQQLDLGLPLPEESRIHLLTLHLLGLIAGTMQKG